MVMKLFGILIGSYRDGVGKQKITAQWRFLADGEADA